MTQYLSEVLKGLERIYEFRSSQQVAPEEMELGLPISIVQDVSALAEYGTGQGQNRGFWMLASDNVHVVTGSLAQLRSVRTPTAALNGFDAEWDPDVKMAWIYNALCSISDGQDYVSSQCLLEQPSTAIGPRGAAGPNVKALLMIWDNFQNLAIGDATTFTVNEPTNVVPDWPMPLLEKNDGSPALIMYNSVANNAGTITVHFANRFWVGSKFAHPPAR